MVNYVAMPIMVDVGDSPVIVIDVDHYEKI
jgi:uncharacterized protein YaaQ